MVEYLWSNISKTPSEGRKRLPRRFKVFGTAYIRVCETCLQACQPKKVGTHMPKSAMTISDEGSLVRNNMFSGLSMMCHITKRGS